MATLAAVLTVTVATPTRAQTMVVSTGTVELPAPGELTYDAGMSSGGAVTIMVTGCSGTLGCRLTIENPAAASPVPIALQWRLTQVSQVGAGTLGCVALTPLLAWQSLGVPPVGLMDTAIVTDPGTACVAAIEVRAVNLAYGVHQLTSPPTTYWRDVLLRTAEK